ncbi:MAG: hypothetical protein EOP48_35025, partial [Sphingobacteriales bacterium]
MCGKYNYLLAIPLIAALYFHPVTITAMSWLRPQVSEERLSRHYASATVDERPLRKPNIVWIYAESFERTYMDEATFPGLTPDLRELEKSSLSFPDISQIGQSGWTIAGIVASQCGIPLVTTGSNGNSMKDMPSFL